MKIYVAVSITNSHNPAMIKQIFDYLESRGHQVLDKHVCYPNHTEVFALITGLDLFVPGPEKVANIVRNQDFKWVEECDLFIGIFFGGSDGRGAEFEHLRLLNELKTNGQLRGREFACKKMLCIFPSEKQSRVVFGISEEEADFIDRYIFNKESEVFPLIRTYIEIFEERYK